MLIDDGSGFAPPKETTEDTVEPGGHGHLLHARTTNTILGAAYRVHSRLGPGLLERAYHACMCIELAKTPLRFESQRAFRVEYEGIPIGLAYRVDLLVEDSVIVEIKAVEKIVPLHESQLLHYLRLSKPRVGLLINFNVAHLKDGIRRRVC